MSLVTGGLRQPGTAAALEAARASLSDATQGLREDPAPDRGRAGAKLQATPSR